MGLVRGVGAITAIVLTHDRVLMQGFFRSNKDSCKRDTLGGLKPCQFALSRYPGSRPLLGRDRRHAERHKKGWLGTDPIGHAYHPTGKDETHCSRLRGLRLPSVRHR